MSKVRAVPEDDVGFADCLNPEASAKTAAVVVGSPSNAESQSSSNKPLRKSFLASPQIFQQARGGLKKTGVQLPASSATVPKFAPRKVIVVDGPPPPLGCMISIRPDFAKKDLERASSVPYLSTTTKSTPASTAATSSVTPPIIAKPAAPVSPTAPTPPIAHSSSPSIVPVPAQAAPVATTRLSVTPPPVKPGFITKTIKKSKTRIVNGERVTETTTIVIEEPIKSKKQHHGGGWGGKLFNRFGRGKKIKNQQTTTTKKTMMAATSSLPVVHETTAQEDTQVPEITTTINNTALAKRMTVQKKVVKPTPSTVAIAPTVHATRLLAPTAAPPSPVPPTLVSHLSQEAPIPTTKSHSPDAPNQPQQCQRAHPTPQKEALNTTNTLPAIATSRIIETTSVSQRNVATTTSDSKPASIASVSPTSPQPKPQQVSLEAAGADLEKTVAPTALTTDKPQRPTLETAARVPAPAIVSAPTPAVPPAWGAPLVKRPLPPANQATPSAPVPSWGSPIIAPIIPLKVQGRTPVAPIDVATKSPVQFSAPAPPSAPWLKAPVSPSSSSSGAVMGGRSVGVTTPIQSAAQALTGTIPAAPSPAPVPVSDDEAVANSEFANDENVDNDYYDDVVLADDDNASEYEELTIIDDQMYEIVYYEEETVLDDSQHSSNRDFQPHFAPPSSSSSAAPIKLEGMELLMANIRTKVPTVH